MKNIFKTLMAFLPKRPSYPSYFFQIHNFESITTNNPDALQDLKDTLVDNGVFPMHINQGDEFTSFSVYNESQLISAGDVCNILTNMGYDARLIETTENS